MNIILIYFAIKYKGDFNMIFKALKDNEQVSYEEVKIIEAQISNKELEVITILDEQYPEQFKYLSKPPFVIFYKGNIKLLKNKGMISLTGQDTRPEVEKFLRESLPEVAKNQTLITNYMPWLDKQIVSFFTQHKKPIIYISCNGLENPYFAKEILVDQNTLIISEYPSQVNISRKRLKERNRLVSALAISLVIYSSKKKSGIMNLVTNFLEMGKEIYCFPGTLNEDDGNTNLIRQGANMITSIVDIN